MEGNMLIASKPGTFDQTFAISNLNKNNLEIKYKLDDVINDSSVTV